ncbi:hypothetical protein KIS4809_5034 [Bacillus sp. ZZV12-4809]|nr:hypothetical protein KIS4809_5034 [Bacillus sp. ZZV12-4809]
MDRGYCKSIVKALILYKISPHDLSYSGRLFITTVRIHEAGLWG